MDASKIRRKPATYGKVNKRLPLHHFFDTSSQPLKVHEPTITPPAAIQEQLQPTIEPEPSELQAQRGGREHAAEALFDISSSDEGEGTLKSLSTGQKRRKLMPGFPTSAPSSTKSDEDLSSQNEFRSDDGLPSRKPGNTTLKGYKRTKPVRKPAPTQTKSQITSRQRSTDKDSRHSSPGTLSEMASTGLESSPPAVTKLSNHSSCSPPAIAQRTPKHKKVISALSEAGATTMSPGKLGFNSLRLTPERPTTPSIGALADAAVYATSPTPRKGRSRLVDRLDAPKSQPQTTSSLPKSYNTSSTSESNNEAPSGVAPLTLQEVCLEPSFGTSEQACLRKSASDHSSTRIKRSYAEQRSCLSDMVSELNRPSIVTSETALDNLLLPDPSTQESIKSQLELDESDSDDRTAGTRIKSIHELRRAGANSRWDREIETIFEDIESMGGNSKSLRLHGLVQLQRKLPISDFVGRLVSAGYMNRLSATALQSTDILSGSLEALVFLTVAAEDPGKFEPSGQLVDAVRHLALLHLEEGRSLSRLARDRKANLSKSTMREISECEILACGQPLWQDHQVGHISPQLIMVRCLATIAGLLRTQGLQPLSISGPVFAHVAQVLEMSLPGAPTISQQPQENIIRDIVVLLESAEVGLASGTGGQVHASSLRSLGHSMGSLLGNIGQDDIDFEQAILRIIVNISNTKPEVCGLLASTRLHEDIFAIIQDNFLQLASSTDAGDEFDKAKLDSVILALGGLLNFADCSIEARRGMIEMGRPPKSSVDWLLQVFNDRVEQASDITTIDQSQVLVAFGYLSMLLCTLCLEANFRQYARPKLYGQSFDELFVAGKTFFIHLKQIEGIDPADDAMSAFSNRFGHILISMREATA